MPAGCSSAAERTTAPIRRPRSCRRRVCKQRRRVDHHGHRRLAVYGRALSAEEVLRQAHFEAPLPAARWSNSMPPGNTPRPGTMRPPRPAMPPWPSKPSWRPAIGPWPCWSKPGALQAGQRAQEAALVLVRAMQLPGAAAGQRASAASLLVQMLPQTGGGGPCRPKFAGPCWSWISLPSPKPRPCGGRWPTANVRRASRRRRCSSTSSCWPTCAPCRSNASTCKWSRPTPWWRPPTMLPPARRWAPCWTVPTRRPGTRPTLCSAWPRWPCVKAIRPAPARR